MDWDQQKVIDLRAELKRRGLPQTGLKGVLVARLTASDAELSKTNAESDREAGDESQAAPATINPTTTNSTTEQLGADAEQLETNRSPQDRAEHESQPAATVETTVNDAPPAQLDADQPTEETTSTIHAEEIDKPESATEQMDVEVTPPTENPESLMQDAPTLEKADREPTAESLQQDSQKRKRRSITPPPSPSRSVNKRQKISMEGDNLPPETKASNEVVLEKAEKEASPRPPNTVSPGLKDPLPPAEEPFANQSTAQLKGMSIDRQPYSNTAIEREVAPSLHPATEALYIRNFMRPLRAPEVKSYLASLATPPEAHKPEETIHFYLDHIRTHAFVLFSNISAASRVRTALHDKVWPEEINRKPLWVDFIPSEKVQEWIDEEESSRASSSTANHWVVLYEDDGLGCVTTRLASSSSTAAKNAKSSTLNKPPSGPSGGRRPLSPAMIMPPPKEPRTANVIPLGPRGSRRLGSDSQQRAPGGGGFDIAPPRGPARREPSGDARHTTTRPGISWQPVSQELVQARLQDMRSYYTKDIDRAMGPGSEINRYTFEDKYRFVDRGKEVFVGIRPPHREREMQRRTRYGGGDGGDGGGAGRDGGRDREVHERYGGGGGGRFGGGRRRRRKGRGRDMPVDSYQPDRDGYSQRDDRSRRDDRRRDDSNGDQRRKDNSPVRGYHERRRDRDD